MIGILVKYRLKMALSMFRGGKKFGLALLLLLAMAGLAFALGSFAYGMYKFAQIEPGTGGVVLLRLASVAFNGMFFFLLFWGFSQAIFTIFFSDDLPLLLSLPIQRRDIFAFKLSEATFLNMRVAFIMLLPVLVVLGMHYRAGAVYYVTAAATVLFLAAVPGALGIIVAAFLSRRIPRARLKGAITVIGGLLGVATWASINRMDQRYFEGPGNFGEEILAATRHAAAPAFDYLPSGWAYRAVAGVATGDFLGAAMFLALLAGAAVMLSSAAYAFTARYYANGVAEEVAAMPRTARAGLELGGSPLTAHVRRDMLLLSRESGVLMQGLIMAIFLLLYPFIANQGNLDEISVLPFSPVRALFAAFFGGQVGSRLIPLERLGFWQNLTSPGGRRLTLASKLIVGLALVTVVASIVSVIHLAAGKASGLSSVIYTLAFVWTGFSVGIPMSVFFGNFKWDHPKRMLKGGGGFFYALFVMIAALTLYGALFAAQRFASGIVSPIIPLVALVAGFLVVSVVVAQIKLENMEWTPDV